MTGEKYRSKVWYSDGTWWVTVEYTCNGHGVWYKCWLMEIRHRFMKDEYIYKLGFVTKEDAEEQAQIHLERIVANAQKCATPKIAELNAQIVERSLA